MIENDTSIFICKFLNNYDAAAVVVVVINAKKKKQKTRKGDGMRPIRAFVMQNAYRCGKMNTCSSRLNINNNNDNKCSLNSTRMKAKITNESKNE